MCQTLPVKVWIAQLTGDERVALSSGKGANVQTMTKPLGRHKLCQLRQFNDKDGKPFDRNEPVKPNG